MAIDSTFLIDTSFLDDPDSCVDFDPEDCVSRDMAKRLIKEWLSGPGSFRS